MKFTWSKSRALVVAGALVLITNAIALGGVAYNRSGEPDSVLQLTERELPLQTWGWPDNENSAIHVRLQWRVAGGAYEWERETQWLTQPQLRSLGFDLPDTSVTSEELERYAHQVARKVFYALEYDGPAYQVVLKGRREELRKAEIAAMADLTDKARRDGADSAKRDLEREEQFASRLFVVGADVDANALRKRYPDRNQYAIVVGRLDLSTRGYELVGQINGIDTDVIRVPYAYRSLVEPLRTQRDAAYLDPPGAPRYQATVHFGRRLEPWIVQLSRM
jgi:hypothetical protein